MANIQKLTLTARIGNDFVKLLNFVDQSGIAIDMTGYSFKMQVRKCKSDTDTILSLVSPTDIDISDVANGNITINISDATTSTLEEQNAVYDLQWTTDAAITTTILEGNFQILETVTK
jgi:hypothetical protein